MTVVLALLATLAAQPAQARPCVEERFEGAGYIVCTIDPSASDLRLFWKDADGRPYRIFSRLAKVIIGTGVGQVAQTFGVTGTSASTGTIISATIPVFVVIFAALRLKQAISRIQRLAVMAASAGIVVVALGNTQRPSA